MRTWKGLAYSLCIVLCSGVFLSLLSCSSGPSAVQTHPTATAARTQATPAAPPIPAGTVLYQADWSKGLADWKAGPGWSIVNGQLQSNSIPSTSIVAPYQSVVPNYAVEARVQIVRILKNIVNGFSIYAADQPGKDGYQGGMNQLALREPDLAPPGYAQVAPDQLDMGGGFQQIDYVPGLNWHTYRIEVQGNEVRLFIDGTPISRAYSRENALSTGPIGMTSLGFLLHISSFRITAL